MAFKSHSQAFPRAVPPPLCCVAEECHFTLICSTPVGSHPNPKFSFRVWFPEPTSLLLFLHALPSTTSHRSFHSRCPLFPCLDNLGSLVPPVLLPGASLFPAVAPAWFSRLVAFASLPSANSAPTFPLPSAFSYSRARQT